jgi:hypothetical protein
MIVLRYIGVDLEQSEYHNEVRPDLYWDGTHPDGWWVSRFCFATEF